MITDEYHRLRRSFRLLIYHSGPTTGSMPLHMLYIPLQFLWTQDSIDFPHLLAERLSTVKSQDLNAHFNVCTIYNWRSRLNNIYNKFKYSHIWQRSRQGQLYLSTLALPTAQVTSCLWRTWE